MASSLDRMAVRARRGVVAGALMGLVILGTRSSRAQAISAPDRETARALMHEGDARRDRKDLKGALESYTAADAIMHVTSTGLEVARTLAQLGQLVEAHDHLVEVMRIAPRPNEPSALAEARVAAQAMSDDLDARIPSIRAVVHGAPPGVTVTVSMDGANIPAAALVAYRRVNPGPHVVSARVGTVERHEEVTVREREKRDVTLDLGSAGLSPDSLATSPGPASPEPLAPPSSSAASPQTGPWRPLAFTGLGVGAAGILVGSITGILSISKANAAKSIPASQGGCVGDQCGPATHSDIDAANVTGNISTVAFIVGGAGLALGVTSFLLGARSSQPSEPGEAGTPRATVSPWIGPLGGGLSGSF